MLSTYSVADDIVIGVRAHNGEEYATQRWMPTIHYLQQHLPEHHIILRPVLHIEDMEIMVKNKQLDFVITQPLAYVDLERLFGATRMLTLQKKDGATQFGSVIIARSDRNDIKTIEDVRGKSIAGVSKKGFGGWLIGYQELQNHGLNSYKDFKSISFLGGHNKVVKSILEGKIDVGIARTGIIERMSSKGLFDISQLRVLNQQSVENFPYKLSTELYPEWAFAKTNKISSSIAKKVAQILLSLPKDSDIAMKGEYSEWIIPLSYNSVHELMKRQKVGSYSKYGDVGTLEFIKQHFYQSIVFIILIMILFFGFIHIFRANKLLRKEKAEKEHALEEIKTLQGIIPICSYCHNIRDDDGAWDKVDAYISKHSEAKFSHGICPKCMVKARSDAGLDNNKA